MKLQRQYITQEHVGGSDLSTIAADKKLKGRFLVHASSEHPLESQPSKSPWDSVNDAVDAFYRFSRPHTIIGTVRSTTPTLSNIRSAGSQMNWLHAYGLFVSMLYELP